MCIQKAMYPFVNENFFYLALLLQNTCGINNHISYAYKRNYTSSVLQNIIVE